MTPSSLTVTPPAPPSKRPRSRESRALSGRPGSHPEVGDAPPPSPGLRIPAFLNQTKAEIAKLFQELEWRQRFRLQHAMKNPESSPFRVERSALILSRNRYVDVQPWEQSRIRLKVPIGGSDYVNASPICLRSRSAPLSPSTHSGASVDPQGTSSDVDLPASKYVATQGPKAGQFSHFWNMVVQETVGDVGVIVMLTQCWEGNKEKCGQYFPFSLETPILDLEPREGSEQPSNLTGDPFLDSELLDGDADGDSAVASGSERSALETHGESDRQGRITLLELYHDSNSRSEVRKLKVQIGDETKTIWHYLFNGWPDYTKPEGEDRRALLELIKKSAAKAENPGLNPRFIHCSAGVGRTGTFIALDFLLGELAHGKLEIIPSSPRPSSSGQYAQNSQSTSEAGSVIGSLVTGKESTPEAKEDLIFETVNMLREQRMMMVMNDVQLSFLYEVLREAYIEMYSPSHLTVVGSGTDRIGDEAEDVEKAGVTDRGEPSPKIARTGDVFVGPSETAQEQREEAERKALNSDAASTNSVVAREADEGALYSPLGAHIVNQKEDHEEV